MIHSIVDDILERIEGLSEADRTLLDQKLAARAEAEWQREAVAARDAARRAGIDQDAIDRAVAHVRYPSKANGE